MCDIRSAIRERQSAPALAEADAQCRMPVSQHPLADA
jgi:hypothetical protein